MIDVSFGVLKGENFKFCAMKTLFAVMQRLGESD